MQTVQEKFEEVVKTIEHWIRVYNGDESIGAVNCPLCNKYSKYPLPCKGCPVYQYTGQSRCENTPYNDVLDHMLDHFESHESKYLTRVMGCPTCSDLIEEELNFLNDILFNILKDREIVLTRQFDEEDGKLYNAFVIDVSRQTGKTFTIKNRSNISWRGDIKTPSGWVPARCFKIYTPIANPVKCEQKKCSITYKQIIVRGEKYVEITGLYGFKLFDELPRAYTLSLESVYLSEYYKGRLNKYNSDTLIEVGAKYKVHDYKTILDTLKIAAQKLHEINAKLEIENADWDGVEKTDYI